MSYSEYISSLICETFSTFDANILFVFNWNGINKTFGFSSSTFCYNLQEAKPFYITGSKINYNAGAH